MAHYSERDINEAAKVNLIEFAHSQGFDMKREDSKAHRIKGYGGLMVFEGGFYHHSEQKKGNPIHFCKEYLGMKFQEAVQTLLDFKGVMREEEFAPKTQYNKPKQNYSRPPPKREVQPPQEQLRREPAPHFQAPQQDFARPQEQHFRPPPQEQRWENPPPQFQAPQQDFARPQEQHFQAPPQEQRWENPPPQFQVPPQDFGRPQEQNFQPPQEQRWENPPPQEQHFQPPPQEQHWGEPPPIDDFYGEPPPIDEYYEELPPEFWGEPPPEANDFYGEPMDYQWGNEYQQPYQEQHFQGNPMVEQHFQGNPMVEQYFQGNHMEVQHFQGNPMGEQHFQGNPMGEQHFQENPMGEQHFQGNPMGEQHFQGNQTQFQQAPPMERPQIHPSQDVPPQTVPVREDSNLEYKLPPAYEHDGFQPQRGRTPTEMKEERGEMVLPPQSNDKDGTASFKYLTETRCCDKEIVDRLMNQGLIFEAETGAKGYKFKNVAFVGKDKNDEPKYCSIRGISKPQAGKEPFKQDVKNSDKSFGFTMKGTSDRIFVCESPIDVLSHASLTKMNGNDPFQDTRISMGGLFDKALDQFLSENPQIKSIVFAFDNDTTGIDSKGQPHNHGQEFAKKCCEKYEKLGFKVQIQTPKGKDFNEVLQEQVKPSVKKQLAYISQEVKTPPKPLVPPKAPKKSLKFNER